MPTPQNIQRAELQEVSWDGQQIGEAIGEPFRVQFNPETLKVSFSNQTSGSNPSGGSAMQFVGQGKTSLSLDLWFDITSPDGVPQRLMKTDSRNPNPLEDVRDLTREVLYFITPKPASRNRFLPPGVQFLWGSFLFQGIMDSANETLEFFSEEGNPLRASISITISQQSIFYRRGVRGSPYGGSTAATAPSTTGFSSQSSATAGFGTHSAASPTPVSALPRGPNGNRTPSVPEAFEQGLNSIRAKSRQALAAMRNAADEVQGAIRRVDEPFQQTAARLGLGDRWQELADIKDIEQPRLRPLGKLLPF